MNQKISQEDYAPSFHHGNSEECTKISINYATEMEEYKINQLVIHMYKMNDSCHDVLTRSQSHRLLEVKWQNPNYW